jgi:HSP20 family molecular chaperone IbpA
VDIRETDKEFQFLVDVPGLTKDDVKVRVSADGVLTIEGERKVGQTAASIHMSGIASEQVKAQPE